MPLLRFVTRDRLSWVMPVEVLVDEPEQVVLWQPAGTTIMTPTGELGGPRGRNMISWDGGHRPAVWQGTGVVRAHQVGRPWSVWRWEDGDRWRPGCYINLEFPWTRTSLGFNSGDWILDVVVDGEGAATLKDADELAWSVEVGRVGQAEADVIHSAATDAIAAMQAGEWPFSADWDAWLPMRTQQPLAPPEGWNAGFVSRIQPIS